MCAVWCGVCDVSSDELRLTKPFYTFLLVSTVLVAGTAFLLLSIGWARISKRREFVTKVCVSVLAWSVTSVGWPVLTRQTYALLTGEAGAQDT